MVLVRLCAFFALLLLVSAQTKYTFVQRVDHFDPQNNATFDQYFWVDESNYKAGGPTLIYLSNFANPKADLNHSAISDWAIQLNALKVELEVRYSGESMPAPDFSTANLRFQSPEQNLADVINFRVAFLRLFPDFEISPWIIVGEFYNGNFALWAREKYPNVIRGAVVVGSPVFATFSFPQYFQFWADVAGEECARAIHDATSYTELLFADPTTDKAAIKSLYDCPIEEDAEFFYSIGQVLQFGIAYGSEPLCSSMLGGGEGQQLMETFASVISQLLSASGLPCSGWNIASTEDISNSFRPTFYLSCVEFGQFQVAGEEGPTVIISKEVSVEWYLSVCRDAFGVTSPPTVIESNVAYGGKNPWGSNYAFVSSSSDPYKHLSVIDTSLPLSSTFSIQTNQSIFSFIAGDNPTKEIAEAREEVLELINLWIAPSPSPSPSPTDDDDDDEDESDGGDYLWLWLSLSFVGVVCVVAAVGFVVGLFIYRKRKNFDVIH